MSVGVLITGYLAVAVFTAGRTFQGAVLQRPTVKHFTFSDQAALTGLCAVVGLAWVLFLPGLAVVAVRRILRFGRAGRTRWLPYPNAARARV